MRVAPVLAAIGCLSLAAQSNNNPPNCNGIGRDADVRCACVKDSSSKLCEMVKAGFYDGTGPKFKPINLTNLTGFTGIGGRPSGGARSSFGGGGLYVPQQQQQPQRTARPRQARVVPLAHKDYLRFLQPNAQLIAGVELGKILRAGELMGGLFGAPEGGDSASKVVTALKEVEHLWLAIAPPNDVVVLMTGHFEQGAMAGLFYAQGVMPVFLGGSQAMMIGPEPSIQRALARLSRPEDAGKTWAAKRARELAKDHETWIVSERTPVPNGSASVVLDSVKQFAIGIRMVPGNTAVEGEVVATSDEGAVSIAEWVDKMKSTLRKNSETGPLDGLTLERAGSTLKFNATDERMLAGDAGKSAMSSDFGVELFALMLGGLPGAPTRTVAETKLFAIQQGMKREDVLGLVGPPLSVVSIQGLETPRETWTYQVPFGKQYSVRLDDGAVTRPPAR